MATDLCAPSPLNAFEQARLDRIAENRRRLEACGILESAKELAKSLKPPVSSRPPVHRAPKVKRQKTRHQPVRRSPRLVGEAAEFAGIEGDTGDAVTYSDYEPLRDLLADGGDIESMPAQKQEQFQEMRCSSAGRGSMYDSVVGITCHFCRQKKLCGEDDCPRCSRRSVTAECIGKSDCSRCHSALGRFCRACLLIRYGMTLEDVREQMEAGTWLCPHCYEDEYPEEGWMCNSSICMKRRGFKPTGIAIYDAQQRGFPSVAHWLQAQLLKGNAGGGAASDGGSEEAAEPEADAAAATPTKAGSSKAASSSCGSTGSAEPAAGTAAKAQGAAAAGAGGNKKAAAAGGRKKGGKDTSRQGSSGGSEADAAVAPSTPLKSTEPLTPGAAVVAAAAAKSAGGASGRRTTRGGVAAAAAAAAAKAAPAPAADFEAAGQGGGKRACVGEAADARRSLRFRK